MSDSSKYYISDRIKLMLGKGKNQVIKKDWDRVYIIDGEEGAGKSLLALQLGYELDPTLNLDRITFTGKDFANAIKDSEKNKCIIFDEAFNGLDSTGAMSKLNRFVVKKLMECRQKNLFLIIVLPTIFLLQKYAAIFRSKVLFHVYATNRGDRGYYKVYNKLSKKLLYLNGKKFYSYAKPYIKKSHRFYGKYPIDEQTYREKKLRSLEEMEDEKKLDAFAIRFALICKWMKERFDVTYADQLRYLKEHDQPSSKGQMSDLLSRIPNSS